ncbi:4-cresol dehydrogenase [hydroxylating] flavoprotein subunit [Rhodoplanes serenus]|uniref:4-cresol dehydrogenase [hydroxylating] flavoprotein subunit n=1 Tax=Rhodoplanes serenus TaxID=200615 RepID=A0A3S4B5F3_9BRAD|nr:FAD-binding oxidoreductase [Rhodoplanes serenus]VCU09593.1 4-cresol dehydrogenase [hydroxylating] flavoprotein subunit [Rhodoplanes serenus]
MSKYVALPAGVSEKVFDTALAEYRAILGPDHVITAAERLVPYNKIMLPVDDERHAPSAAICPGSVEEVQRCVAVCNKHKVPVWPISTGKNFGYGSAAPATRGQVVMDLRRMNRILDVDADLCTALVEPGVTYQQMYDHLQDNKIPLWLSCPAPSAIVGPLGNTVDRGVGYTPYGEHFMFQCGMEVVLPDASLLRTGMGSLPNSNTWQVFKWGYGPYLDGIFTQSNYGIVTKMGLWLMPAPPDFRPFVIRYDDEADIVTAVETLRPLRMANIIPNAVVIVHALWEAGSAYARSDHFTGPGAFTDDAVRTMVKKTGMGVWNLYAGLYGSPEQNDVAWKIVQGAVKASGKGRILTAAEVGEDPVFKYRADLMQGRMNTKEFGLYNWRGGGGSCWFAPVSQARGSETLKQMEMAKRILNRHGIDYVAEFIVGWRDMHHVIDLLFDRTDFNQTRAAHACYRELLQEFAAQGYGVYRANTAFMDEVADCYGDAKRKINATLKRALDPNGIIAPGKSGIWATV